MSKSRVIFFAFAIAIASVGFPRFGVAKMKQSEFKKQMIFAGNCGEQDAQHLVCHKLGAFPRTVRSDYMLWLKDHGASPTQMKELNWAWQEAFDRRRVHNLSARYVCNNPPMNEPTRAALRCSKQR